MNTLAVNGRECQDTAVLPQWGIERDSRAKPWYVIIGEFGEECLGGGTMAAFAFLPCYIHLVRGASTPK